MTDQPPMPEIYLSGPMPSGAVWCATCCMIFMGAISSEVEFQKMAKELHEAAAVAGHTMMTIDLVQSDRMQLQPAVTVGPSWKLPNGSPPMPVCWTHLTGLPPAGTQSDGQQAMEQRSSIIPGKAYTPVWQQGERR